MKAIVKYGGERIERIARALLGTELDGAVEALLAANPGLGAAEVNGVIPEGFEVVAPVDWSPAASTQYVLAWK